MTQYFQLTPDILLEYIYEGDPKLNEDGVNGNSKDISKNPLMLLKSEAFSSKYLCFKKESEGLDSLSNLVLPLNNTETQFVIAKSNYSNFFSRTNASNRFLTKNGSGYMYMDANFGSNNMSIQKSCDVRFDKCVIHFTSRNYFGTYDSLIFQTYVYMNDKSKFYLSSFLFKKTSNLEMKPEHLLYNEKLYTTQIEFDIPSVYAIFSKDESIYNKVFNEALAKQNITLLQNTPIGVNVYGVSGSTKGTDNYERLKTNKISSISIPYIYNRFDEIYVNISEAVDGDFFYIDPEMGDGYSSFSDYIETMGEDIRAYMIMHELCLKESWVENGENCSEITHKEFHIIDINEDDEDDEISKRFDAKIKFRPICMKGGLNYRATIIDTIKIINTVDSSSYEVSGSLEITNPNKYGKKIKKLDFNNELRPIVNVYNKSTTNGSNGSNSVSAYGSTSGSKKIGSLSGSFSLLGSGSGGAGGDTGESEGNTGGSGSGTGGSGDNTGGNTGGSGGNTGGSGDNTGGSGNGSGSGIGPGGSDTGNGDISGSYYGDISGIGSIEGNISGSISDSGVLSGNISGSLSVSGGFITGTFTTDEYGNITGSISGYIPGIGYITGTISGTYHNDGLGDISASINSSSNSSDSNSNNSNSNSNSDSSNVIIKNGGGGFIVENYTQNITSFIECTNVGVIIDEISPDYLY